MSELGRHLRQARERAGLTVTDLAARTKIRESILDAMERGDFRRMPSGVLGRGFLRAYAREVGLDPESIVSEYTAELEPDTRPANVPDPEVDAPAELPGSGRGAQLLAAFALTAAALVVLVVLPSVGTELPQSAAAPAATETTRRDADSTASRATPAPGPVESVPGAIGTTAAAAARELVQPLMARGGAEPAGDQLVVEIVPKGVVWVEASADGQRVLYRLVDANERARIDVRDELVLRVGDAAAFDFSINGRPGRPLGGPSEVRDVRITRDNLAMFLAAP